MQLSKAVTASSFLILVFFLFGAFLFLPKQVFATTIAPSAIDTDTVWTAAESPYLLAGTVTVASSATLTLEAGAVVKSTRNGAFEILGSLRVQGTTSTPVIFTSYKDDTAGGDTNSDGAASTPAGGDWQWIKFLPLSNGLLDHAELRYGGYKWISGATDGQLIADQATVSVQNSFIHDGHALGDCVRLAGASATISHSDLSGALECVRVEGGNVALRENAIHGNSWAGISINSDFLSGSPIISGNRIYENTNYGIASSNVATIDARLNQWSDTSNPSSIILGNVLYDPWLGKAREPVLVIPGIMGSWQKHGQWVIDPILHTYDNLLDAFRAAGYRDGETLFTFPYDWKISNVLTAHYLRDRLAEIRSTCHCTKINVIAHSMGGLVARQYISSSEYADDVDQVIFLGTPHRGAPKDYLTWEAGEMGPARLDALTAALLALQGVHLGYTNLFDYIHNYPIPTVQELLPTYNYLRNAADSTIRLYSHCEEPSGDVAISPCQYPANSFLENLNSDDALTRLVNSHVRFTNIVGDTLTSDTINMLRVGAGHCEESAAADDAAISPPCVWQHGAPENYDAASGDHGLELGSGDKTVPLSSATYFGVNGTDQVTVNADHGSLPTETQTMILEKLGASTALPMVTSWHMPNAFLLIRVFSPVDIRVTDPEGNIIGKDFSSSTSELNQIPNAFYSGSDTDNEFVLIPNPQDGEYHIATQGTGSGEFRISSTLIRHCDTAAPSAPSGSESSSSSSPSGVEGSCASSVSAGSPVLESEYSGTTSQGEFINLNLDLNQTTATPTITVQPIDTTPPTVTISSPTLRDYAHGETITITTMIADAQSGVASHEIKLDGKIIRCPSSPDAESTSLCPLDTFFYELGNHTLDVRATDVVGNSATSTVQFRVVATLESLISDINRAYALGWIRSATVRKVLLDRAQNVAQSRRAFQSTINNYPRFAEKLEQTRRAMERSILKSFLVLLDAFRRSRQLAPEAAALLTEDINWLLNNQ